MRIHYALYDPQPQPGSFWTWFSPALSEELCEAVFSAYLSEHLSTPQGRANLGSNDVFGGIIRLHDKWTVVYRLLPTRRTGLNGRYDFVIITAWIETRETHGVDLSSILKLPVFQNVASKASMHPVPRPESLTETIDPMSVKTPILSLENRLLQDSKSETSNTVVLARDDKEIPLPKELTKTFIGDKCDTDAAVFLADVPRYRIVMIPIQPLVWVKIEKIANRNLASVEIKPNTHPITIAPKPKPPKPESWRPVPPAPSSVESEVSVYPSDRDLLLDLWQWSKKSLFTLGGCCYTVFGIFVVLVALILGNWYGLFQNRKISENREKKVIVEHFKKLQRYEQVKLIRSLAKDLGYQVEPLGSPPPKSSDSSSPDTNKIRIDINFLPTKARCLCCGQWIAPIPEQHYDFVVDTSIAGGNISELPRVILPPQNLYCRSCNVWLGIPEREFHITVTELPDTKHDTIKTDVQKSRTTPRYSNSQ